MNESVTKQLKMLQVISAALISGVTLFAAIATVLAQGEGLAFEPVVVPTGVLAGIAIVTILGASKLARVLQERSAVSRDDVLQNYSLSIIIPQALRESVGLLGVVAGLVSANPTTVIGFAAVSVATMLVSFPRATDLTLVLRKFDSGRAA